MPANVAWEQAPTARKMEPGIPGHARHKSASSVLTHELKVQDVTGSDPLARGAEVAYNTQPPTTNQPRVHLTEQQAPMDQLPDQTSAQTPASDATQESGTQAAEQAQASPAKPWQSSRLLGRTQNVIRWQSWGGEGDRSHMLSRPAATAAAAAETSVPTTMELMAVNTSLKHKDMDNSNSHHLPPATATVRTSDTSQAVPTTPQKRAGGSNAGSTNTSRQASPRLPHPPGTPPHGGSFSSGPSPPALGSLRYTPRRISGASGMGGVSEVEELNSIATQAGSATHSFSSLHSMLVDLDVDGSIAEHSRGGSIDGSSSVTAGSIAVSPSAAANSTNVADSILPTSVPSEAALIPANPATVSDGSSGVAGGSQHSSSSALTQGSEQTRASVHPLVPILDNNSVTAGAGAASQEWLPILFASKKRFDSADDTCSYATQVGSVHSVSSLASCMEGLNLGTPSQRAAQSPLTALPHQSTHADGASSSNGGSLSSTTVRSTTPVQGLHAPSRLSQSGQSTASGAATDDDNTVTINDVGMHADSNHAAAHDVAVPQQQASHEVALVSHAPLERTQHSLDRKPSLKGAMRSVMAWGSGLGQRLGSRGSTPGGGKGPLKGVSQEMSSIS
eukprot:jgi/Chrzof1/12865/Cz07g10060.t1